MIKRQMKKTLLRLAKQYPVITLTGPRQSSKTTLFLKKLNFYKKLNSENKKSFLIYTGTEKVQRYGHTCLPYLLV